jgi:2-dehydro-3-deoxy-D-arabinonate dehydratase
MKLFRFLDANGRSATGVLFPDGRAVDLTPTECRSFSSCLESEDLVGNLERIARQQLPALDLASIRFLAPVEQQEIWAAGVTYLRSKSARMDESDFSAGAYDRVYEASRPELFFKAMPEKVVAHAQPVGIRRDARWSVPEPELALILNSRGRIAGYTIGNDMSSRDIEGENLLYLPQAKVYARSCALGPWCTMGVSEREARTWTVSLEIERQGQSVFKGQTSVDQIKRSFTELVEYLFRSQDFPHGVVLLTGTGIVPPNEFTLEASDRIRMGISGIGTLENTVIEV